jgi:hypothetical protein
MPTHNQNQANRLNAQESTGPRSIEGDSVSRFNGLKTGIDAQSQVIPGEDPAVLEALTLEYYDYFQPATAVERFLVDIMITADWQLRRLHKFEAQIWEDARRDWRLQEDLVSSGLSFIHGEGRLARLQETESQAPPSQPDLVNKPILRPAPDPEVQQNQCPQPQIGFVSHNFLRPPAPRPGVASNHRRRSGSRV